MNTDARRKASAAYHAKRTAEGARKVTVWLSLEAQAALAALATLHGSKDAAVCAALIADAKPRPVIKAKPEPARVSVPFGGDVVRKPMQKKGK